VAYNDVYPEFKQGSLFGAVRPNEKFGFHGGADYKAPPGTTVRAIYGGEVFRSGLVSGENR
jgi:murein DD-endopeptidase MepM/ murein hydrolase activator NlpD